MIDEINITFSLQQLTNFLVNTVITIMLAYILHILFESPVLNILKIFESKKVDSNNNNNIEKNNNLTKL